MDYTTFPCMQGISLKDMGRFSIGATLGSGKISRAPLRLHWTKGSQSFTEASVTNPRYELTVLS